MQQGFTGIVDAIPEADRDVPHKQRHTAQRTFNIRCGTSMGSPAASATGIAMPWP